MTEFEPDQPWSPRQAPAPQGPASAPMPLVSPDGQLPGAGYPPQQPAQGYAPQQPVQQQPTQGYAPQQPVQQQPAQQPPAQGYPPQQPVQQPSQNFPPQQPVQQPPAQAYAPQQPALGYPPQQPVQQPPAQGYPPQQPAQQPPAQGYAPQQPAQGYAPPQQPAQQPPALPSFAPAAAQAQPTRQPDLPAQQGTNPYAAPRPDGYLPPSQPAIGAPQTGVSNGYPPAAVAQPTIARPQGPVTGSQPAIVPQPASQPWGQQAAGPAQALPPQPPAQQAPPGGGGFFAPVGAPSATEHMTPARTPGDRDDPERGEADKRGVSPVVASLLGLLAAIVAAIGYASLSFAVGKEYMALLILIGAAAGFTVSLSVREESLGTGIVSMVWSVLGVFAASSLLVAMTESGSIVGGFSAFPAVDFYAVFLGYFQQVLNYVWLLAALFVGYLTGAGARFR